MKILFLLLLPLFSLSQPIKLKAYQAFLTVDAKHELAESDWEKCDFLVVLDWGNKKIKTYGEKEGDYDLVNKLFDDKNDTGIFMDGWDAIDGDGKKCIIFLTFFHGQDSPVANITIKYPEVELFLRLKKD